MTKKMLIDATHAEETRVAVVDGTRLVDYDYESRVRKQLKGSIFLAKVTRVEPSLQAAFVNFGGNRHGFLPFAEIHPDYFRIPIADREALIAEQEREMQALREEEEAEEAAAAAAESAGLDPAAQDEDEEEEEVIEEIGGEDVVPSLEPEEGEEEDAESGAGKPEELESASISDFSEARSHHEEGAEGEYAETREASGDFVSGEDESHAAFGQDEENPVAGDAQEGGEAGAPQGEGRGHGRDRGRGRGRGRNGGRGRGGRHGGRDRMAADSRRVEILGGDGIEGDHPVRPFIRRNYKIQEVIKRGQIMLVQVSKEERGNKGAAVTTYISLPGRYCVLMPNSPRAGGVSRKIANFKERRRMREILAELQVPDGMSVIMRTAGMSRTKAEIKRDLDYLMRLWDNIRDLTLQSTAPAIVHEEGNLIRRAVRDIYGRDVDEIIVAGDEGFKLARDFMKMMIPSHVKRVKQYVNEQMPLFHRHQVESQIAAMSEATVTLKSGGYLVINPTEALVSVDVNSGRATRERHIEETAVKTNLEAADEVARQLRLRDLGGLVVIDFIDMEDRRNNRKVENRLRDALSTDRARIQMGRISSFGLLEMSRQRLNPSLTEAQFQKCDHCKGIGYVRTIDSAAIMTLRALEDEGIRSRSSEVILKIPNEVAIYILNNKRAMLAEIEKRYNFTVTIRVDETLAPIGFAVEPVKGAPARRPSDDRGGEVRAELRHEVTYDDEVSEGAAEEAFESDAEGQDAEGEDRERPRENTRQGQHQHHRDAQGGGERGERSRGGRRRGRRGGRGRGRDRGGERDNRFQGQGDQNHYDDNIGNVAPAPESEEDEINGNVRLPDDHDDGQPGNERQGYRNEGGRNHRGGRGGRNNRGRRQHRDHREQRDSYGGNESQPQSRAVDNVVEAPRPVVSEPVPEPVAASVSRASNDAAPPAPKEYEQVNETSGEKKKGWWNRLTE